MQNYDAPQFDFLKSIKYQTLGFEFRYACINQLYIDKVHG